MRAPVSPPHTEPHLSFPPPRVADFSTIKARCEGRSYTSVSQWLRDAQLVTDNARKYNRPETDYYQCANKVDVFISARLRTAAWATGGASKA
jgi:hypothetical protein